MATVMKQAAFARRHGVSGKTVTMWKKRGWVVTCDGKVNVEESEANLKKYRAAGISKNLTPVPDANGQGNGQGNDSVLAQLKALDWQHPVADWSEEAQEKRARLACQCFGDIVMVQSDAPFGDGNWGGWQLRIPRAEHHVSCREQIWNGYGYELEPHDVLGYLRDFLLAEEDTFEVIARPDLLHALALPIYEWQEPPSPSEPLGDPAVA